MYGHQTVGRYTAVNPPRFPRTYLSFSQNRSLKLPSGPRLAQSNLSKAYRSSWRRRNQFHFHCARHDPTAEAMAAREDRPQDGGDGVQREEKVPVGKQDAIVANQEDDDGQ